MHMMGHEERMARKLQNLMAETDLTIEELVGAADSLLADLAPKQSRYKVTDRPDVRTIRYYISQKLLPGPVSYQGGRARYSGAHLIRLLLIKKMQAEHHTLKRISRMLEDATDAQVLAKLASGREGSDLSELTSIRVEGSPATQNRQSMTLQRFCLPHGGTIDVPEENLRSPSRRQELADALEALARSLRSKTEQMETKE